MLVLSVLVIGFLYMMGAFTPAAYGPVCVSLYSYEPACVEIPRSLYWRAP
jgi:hypothetical protein